MADGLVLGLNAYTHSAAACLLAPTGEILFAGAKERLTRKKHDGGDVAELVEHALGSVGVGRDALALVVANNHLFRIDRYEADLPWAVAQYSVRASQASPWNLLPGTPRRELSHHLAHAWSVLVDAPEPPELIVVMDGMGSTLHDMQLPGADYESELALPRADGFREVHDAAEEPFGWREAETVYQVVDGAPRPLFKRWTPEPKPALLHNYGFEAMESLGAVYSRVASHVFGDWNACGKVMGLAPWAPQWAADLPRRAVLRGPLEELRVDWERLRAEPHPHRWAEQEYRGGYARLAADVQADLEDVVLDFLTRLRERSGATRLALAGGVALNSTLNGRIARETGFDAVFVPPWPGDDGIAVGCARRGHALLERPAPARRMPSARLGAAPAPVVLAADAVEDFGPWLEPLAVPDAAAGDDPLAAFLAEALDRGVTIGWWRGRAEFGPRALGGRSIVADPRRADMVERLNLAVKKRERFRPFAPTVLAEHAEEWFEDVTPSPYMSLTVTTRPERRAQIPAVVHADGSARIQTLTADDDPAWRALVAAFHARTGVPMVLNTSFNIRGEPIVESARDAAWTFLRSELELLVLADRVYLRRPFPDPLTGERLPLAVRFTAEVVSDNSGESLATRVMAWGETFDLEPLEFGLLEACDGSETVGELAERFRAEWEVDPDETVARLRGLHDRCLLHFAADPAEG